MTDTKALTPIKEKFILHWGEMGSRWGINRTVAQIHALLYLSEKPVPADEIADALSVARSNVSTSIKELQSWGIVKSVHVMGDRRAHYESMKDVWDMFHVILDERKRREVDPTLDALKECVDELEESNNNNPYTKERLSNLLDFMQTASDCHGQLTKLPSGTLRKLAKMGNKVQKLLDFI